MLLPCKHPAGKNAWRRRETMMKDLQELTPGTAVRDEMPIPLTAWWSGFDYAFGYQIKSSCNNSGDFRQRD